MHEWINWDFKRTTAEAIKAYRPLAYDFINTVHYSCLTAQRLIFRFIHYFSRAISLTSSPDDELVIVAYDVTTCLSTFEYIPIPLQLFFQ